MLGLSTEPRHKQSPECANRYISHHCEQCGSCSLVHVHEEVAITIQVQSVPGSSKRVRQPSPYRDPVCSSKVRLLLTPQMLSVQDPALGLETESTEW